MLASELRGAAYSKAEHRRALKAKLNDRTDGSIERKHQNISAVLIDVGFPFISGYKPLRNYQSLLFDVVLDRMVTEDVVKPLAQSVVSQAARAGNQPLILVDAPRTDAAVVTEKPPRPYAVRGRVGVDYLALKARNSSLGNAGEETVLKAEITRLRTAGKPRLADRVEWTSRVRGDGMGFDILSFESSGTERFIEVKTTTFGKETPFYVTRGELQFSVDNPNQFHLYRLFDFRKAPKMFQLSGGISTTCMLDPSQFLARPA